MPTDDDAFLSRLTSALAGLPAVVAVALGGSRATGRHRQDSDWDVAVYYRGDFAPAALRALGWEGEVAEIGGWGGGVFNGDAWLTVEGRRVDVHHRDLDSVERRLAEAREGRFPVERLLFPLAGAPSYLPVAERAVNRVLSGHLPRPAHPEALRRAAPPRWAGEARATLAYARAAHAPNGHLAECAGAVATAACQAAHGVLAARGAWVTHEKTLLERAGLRAVDAVLDGPGPAPDALAHALDRADALVAEAVGRATAP